MNPLAPEIIFIPLDDRPCCFQFPQRLADLAGASLITPARELLGGLSSRGNCLKLVEWCKQHLTAKATILASIDMIAWGGLVGSRDPVNLCEKELGVMPLRKFLTVAANNPLLAFDTIMRIAPTQKSVRDVLRANLIQEISVLMHKHIIAKRQEEHFEKVGELKDLVTELGQAELEEYLRIRTNKHALNDYLLGCFERNVKQDSPRFLLFCIDDSQPFGLNIFEAEELQKEIDSHHQHAQITTGTDEIAMLLLARSLAPQATIGVSWSSGQDELRLTRYEDRPLGKVLEAQASASLINIDTSLYSQAQTQLFIFGPSTAEQAEATAQPISQVGSKMAKQAQELWRKNDCSDITLNEPQANTEQPDPLKALSSDASQRKAILEQAKRLKSFLDSIAAAIKNGKQAIVADLGYANGACNELCEGLIASRLINKISGYFAWNTAGNTLGSALALAALTPPQRAAQIKMKQTAFLLERLADDYLYQANLRQIFSKRYGGSFIPLSSAQSNLAEKQIQAILFSQIKKICRRCFGQYEIESFTVRLPWHRLFEIEVEIILREITV